MTACRSCGSAPVRIWLTNLLTSLLQQARAEVTGDDVEAAREAVTARVSELSALAHLDGALRARELAAMPPGPAKRAALAARPKPRVPNVPFAEAIEDLARRQPRAAASAVEVARMYADPNGPYFSFTSAPSEVVAARVRDAIAQAVRDGTTANAADVVRSLVPITKAHAQTIVRTNVTGAEARGRIQQARRMPAAFPAMEVVTAGDSRVRPSHAAMEGFRAAVDWPGWASWAHPPFRADPWSCRCGIRLLALDELIDDGLADEDGNLSRKLTHPKIPRGAEFLAGG